MDIDLITEKLNQIVSDAVEYETEHKDAASNYAHLVAESWHSEQVLGRYEIIRRKDNLLMQSTMDVLYHTFSHPSPLIKTLRNASLLAVNTLPLIKSVIKNKALAYACGDRFKSLGMPAERISVDGSIKYDLNIPRASTAQGESWRAALGIERPVLIAASTHQGEDQVALEAWSRLQKALADAVLIIVPRHPERFDSVFKLAQQFSAHVERRSSELPPSRDTQIWIGDSLGEMLAYYAAADLAFVGGSFSGTGGHNPLEPAALGKPIIMGPSRFNFASISSKLEAEGALFEAKDSSELADTALALFTDAGSAGVAAKQVVERNRGALDRVQAQVERCLQC